MILDHFADLTTAKKRYLTDEELKSFENYLENPADTTRLVIFAEGKLDSKRRLVKLLKRDGKFLRLQNSRKQIYGLISARKRRQKDYNLLRQLSISCC